MSKLLPVTDESVQRVSWAIDYDCSPRSGLDSTRATTLVTGLARAVAFDWALRSPSAETVLIGDTLIESKRTWRSPSSGSSALEYPDTGWLVSERLAPLGGTTKLYEHCGVCPANSNRHGIVGCCGQFSLDPDDTQLQEVLTNAILESGLETSYSRFFPVTKPLWYGLWTVKRLNDEALEIFETLVSSLVRNANSLGASRTNPSFSESIEQMRHGIELARVHGRELLVELEPPQRQILDLVKTFAHCPRCKALAVDQKWVRRRRVALQVCTVCENSFSPAETETSHRVSAAGLSLYDLLGANAYRELTERYLIQQGLAASEAGAFADAITATVGEERAFVAQMKGLRVRQLEYLNRYIYEGIPTLLAPGSDFIEDEEADEGPEELHWYNRRDFEVVLRRAKRKGLKVRYMTHIGSEIQDERHVWEDLEDPIGVYRQWVTSGCDGKFSALLVVPTALLESEVTQSQLPSDSKTKGRSHEGSGGGE